jgi:hypothetical protein
MAECETHRKSMNVEKGGRWRGVGVGVGVASIRTHALTTTIGSRLLCSAFVPCRRGVVVGVSASPPLISQ